MGGGGGEYEVSIGPTVPLLGSNPAPPIVLPTKGEGSIKPPNRSTHLTPILVRKKKLKQKTTTPETSKSFFSISSPRWPWPKVAVNLPKGKKLF